MDGQFIEETPQEEQTWQIPPGHIFVCGDNREKSIDSRTWGPLPQHNVRGVVLMKLSRSAQVAPQITPGMHRSIKWGLPVGHVAPPFIAFTPEGTKVTSQDFQGQAILFFFFFALLSSSMPTLFSQFEAIAARATRAGMAVLFVSAGNLEATRRFLQEWPNLRPLLLAHQTQNTLLLDFEVGGMPCYCLVDQAGVVRASGLPLSVLDQELDRLSQELTLARHEQQMAEY